MDEYNLDAKALKKAKEIRENALEKSFFVFNEFPVFAVPLFICLIAESYIFILLFNHIMAKNILMIVYLLYLMFFLYSLSAFILLELMEQHETTNRRSLLKALKEAIFFDLPRAIPIIVIWPPMFIIAAILELVFLFEHFIFRGNRYNDSGEVVAHIPPRFFYGGPATELGRYTRMRVFFIFPIIAWGKEMNIFKILKEGSLAYKKHKKIFLEGLSLISLASIIILIPNIALLYLKFALDMNIDVLYKIVLVFSSFIATFAMYAEQIYSGLFYMWHLKWKYYCKKAKARGDKLPTITSIRPPSLLNDRRDLFKDDRP